MFKVKICLFSSLLILLHMINVANCQDQILDPKFNEDAVEIVKDPESNQIHNHEIKLNTQEVLGSVFRDNQTADQLLDQLDQLFSSYEPRLNAAKTQVEFLVIVEELRGKFEEFTNQFNKISSTIDPKDAGRINDRFSQINQKYIAILQSQKNF